MEENMGQVNTMIGNLRNMALDMGSELENQNRMVDRINAKVMIMFAILLTSRYTDTYDSVEQGESNETRIAVANERAHQLLK